MPETTNPARWPRCDVCGETIAPNGELAEMYDPKDRSAFHFIVHTDCGLTNGLAIA